jgi:AcrR family transcriptional regulator
LFAERGPENVSIRQIAQAAGVEQNQVLHFFGSKDGLVNAVLDRSANDMADALAKFDETGDIVGLLGDGGPIDRHARVIAHLLLDWRDPASLQSTFPVANLMVDRVRRLNDIDEPAARRRVAQVIAVAFGWRLFEPFLSAAIGPDVVDEDLTALADAVLLLLARPAD